MKNKKMISLKVWLLMAVLLGFVCGGLVGLLSNFISDKIIEKTYFNDAEIEKRTNACFDSFSQYIVKKKVSSKDSVEISKWLKGKKDISVLIYDESGEVIFQSGIGGIFADTSEETEDSSNEEDHKNNLPSISNGKEESIYDRYVSFSDGDFLVSIYEFSGQKWYRVADIITIASFLITLFTVLLVFNTTIIRRVKKVSESVNRIGNGNYAENISCKGNDEISRLASDVNRMKTAILSGRDKEEKAMQANRELITSMSHDIRTPLTSLMGYLDIIDSKGYSSEKQWQEYIAICRSKALQLKELSDKLFGYFLVFGKDTFDMEPETYDLSILFGQLIGEHVYYLTGKGYKVKRKESTESGKITVDIHYLVRIFDNIFSNVVKYADKTRDIAVEWWIKENYVIMTVENVINREENRAESTNIGLKTCCKIAEEMKGEFKAEKKGRIFCVELILPIQN